MILTIKNMPNTDLQYIYNLFNAKLYKLLSIFWSEQEEVQTVLVFLICFVI